METLPAAPAGDRSPRRHTAVPPLRCVWDARLRGTAALSYVVSPLRTLPPRRTTCPRQPAGDPSSPVPACGSLCLAPSPNWGRCPSQGRRNRHHLRRLQHLFGLLCGVDPMHRLPFSSGCWAAGIRVYPSGSRIAADQAETDPLLGSMEMWHAPAARMAVPLPTGPRSRRRCAVVGNFTSLRSPDQVRGRLGSPEHAARHRPRRSNRTSPQPALPPSLSGWRRTARPAAHPCGRHPAGASTPFYTKTSVRGFAPPFIEAHITECPERQFHSGSCWSVAAGQRIVLAPRRTSKKFRKVPNPTLHVCMP